MSVAVVATVPHAGHRLYEQRLASALAPHSPVAYLEPPTSPRSWAQVRRGAVLADGGRTRVQPAWTLPFSRRLGLAGLRHGAARRAARRALPHLGGRADAVVFTEPSGALDALPGARRVLLVKDDYVAGAHLLGRRPEDVERDLRASVATAHAVVAVSPVLRDRLRRLGVEAEVIPAGCRLAPTPPADVPVGRPRRAVFLGGLGPRVVPEHLRAVLDAGLELVVLGGLVRGFPPGPHRTAVEAVLADPRVDWRGPLGPDEVAAALAQVDVGLVPYDASPFNLASFPLKVLEYLAAGVPVVSTPMPAVDWIGTDRVRVEADAAGFGAAAAELAHAATPEVRAACRAVAAEHTWERRATAWLDVLGLARDADVGGLR